MTEDMDVPKPELPEEWKEIDFQELFAKGWRPRIKNRGEKQYITIRCQYKDDEGHRKDEERSLGPYDPERWELLSSLFPKKTWNPDSQLAKPANVSTRMFVTNLGRHKAIPPSMSIDTDILQYYQWVRDKGYEEPLDRFIQECARNYFIQNGIGLAIKVPKGMDME